MAIHGLAGLSFQYQKKLVGELGNASGQFVRLPPADLVLTVEPMETNILGSVVVE